MKTKFYTLIAAIVLSSAPVLACKDSLSVSCEDQPFHFWEGFDIGVNGYMNVNNSIATPETFPFLELDYARSRSFSWNVAQYNFHIYKNYINIVTGAGFEWTSYALKQNVSLATDVNMVTVVNETLDFTKNKLRSTWVKAPLMLEFNTNKDEDKSFHIAAGAEFGYNIFRNRLKQEYTMYGDEQERKTKDDFNLNPFRYSLIARVGFGKYTLFANYGLSEVFKKNQGPQVYPFSAGINIHL
ncbi:MAG: PorT family protein [Bacteroidota bacterium]|nr:PorT family protein [Bacteroidota bacterium]